MGGETKHIPVKQKDEETEDVVNAETGSGGNGGEKDRPAVDESIVEEFKREHPPGSEVTGTVKEFNRVLAEARRQADEHHDKYLRAVAELENVRQRLEKTYQSRVTQAQRNLLRQFLEVADNLERALDAAKDGGDIVSGVELTYRQLQRLLADHNVEPIEAVGQPFDPMKHEAVSVVPANGVEDETVVAEELRGYTHQNELLRPSRVYVAKETADKQASES